MSASIFSGTMAVLAFALIFAVSMVFTLIVGILVGAAISSSPKCGDDNDPKYDPDYHAASLYDQERRMGL